jgi:hypothetical protein
MTSYVFSIWQTVSQITDLRSVSRIGSDKSVHVNDNHYEDGHSL